jgi:hypothetical protein
MRTRIAVPTLVSLLVVVPAAEAKLPSPPTKLIVPGRSIAGVKLGMKAEDAVKKWGKGSECDEVVGVSCHWRGTMKQGSARFDVRDGKVYSITITAGQKPVTFDNVYRKPLVKWKTAKKVGLGTSLYTVGKKYKKAKPDGGGLALSSGKRETLFSSSGGRVASLIVQYAQ